MKKRLSLMGLFFIIMLALQVYSVSIGISPGRVEFDNLLRDGYAERTVIITTSSEEEISGHFKVTGDIKDWLSFEPSTDTFTMSRSNPYRLKIIIRPPADMPTGNYSGNIEFITDTIGSIGGRAGGIIKTAVILILNSEVSGEEITECSAGAFEINDVEEGFPIEFSANIFNGGNVRIRPKITVDIWDQLQENLLLTGEYTGEEVLPTTERKITGQIKNNLAVGQYWATIKAEECGSEAFLTFNIVEEGGIVDKGYFKGLLNQPWVYVGQTVEIVAEFLNQGKRSVKAKFKGAIRRDDEIVEVIETDEILVPSGEQGDFFIYFTPKEEGRYTLNGRILYNKKLTFEKGTVINAVLPEAQENEESNNFLPFIIYLVIIVTIIFILRKIIKERKKH